MEAGGVAAAREARGVAAAVGELAAERVARAREEQGRVGAGDWAVAEAQAAGG